MRAVVRLWCIAVALLIVASPAIATESSFTVSDIAQQQITGAQTFYDNGYTGTRSTVANIEPGLIWNGHDSLTSVTTQIYDPSITPQFDKHATWVGSIIGGRGSTVQARGIAYGSTLWSGAIATNWNPPSSAGGYSGSFSISYASFATPYMRALVTGVGAQNKTADVVNSSYTDSSVTDGSDYLSRTIDALASALGKTVVIAAGNGTNANTVGLPGTGTNAIVVGASTADFTIPQYGSVASFSSRSPTDFFRPTKSDGSTGFEYSQIRARVDIVAPGTNLSAAHYGGATGGNSFGGASDSSTSTYESNLAGTSFAAPIVAAAAALLIDVGKDKFAANPKAIDGRVIKAVLLNSASKPNGWDNGQAIDADGVITTSQSLDNASGAGLLNLDRAYSQYTTGTTGLGHDGGGSVQLHGWDYSTITHDPSQTAHVDYALNQTLTTAGHVTVTLSWFSNASFNQNTLTPTYGDFDDLDLEVWKTTNGIPTTLIAQSYSPFNSVEHLDFAVPQTGSYLLRVAEDNFNWNFDNATGTNYALAWNATVPEPGSMMFILLALLLLCRRRAAMRC